MTDEGLPKLPKGLFFEDINTMGQKEETHKKLRGDVVMNLMKQGIGNPEQILKLLNFDENGNEIGDFTVDEVQRLQPKTQQLPKDIISMAEELCGLKLKKNVPYYSVPLEQDAMGRRRHLGHTEGGVILVDSNFRNSLDVGYFGETTRSNLIHETLHNILEQHGTNERLSPEQRETIVKEAEFYYLDGGKGLAPSMKFLQGEGE